MVVIPVYEVTKLQLPLRKKLTVALMFIVGSLYAIPSLAYVSPMTYLPISQSNDHRYNPSRRLLEKPLGRQSDGRSIPPRPLVRDRNPNRRHVRLSACLQSSPWPSIPRIPGRFVTDVRNSCGGLLS
jgi:hypothetical protein